MIFSNIMSNMADKDNYKNSAKRVKAYIIAKKKTFMSHFFITLNICFVLIS